MFDPTVYENVKVVLEGSVYDLDLAGSIHITGREDRLDLSSLTRQYKLRFQLKGDREPAVTAEVDLTAGLSELAAEVLEMNERPSGCFLSLSFELELPPDTAPDDACRSFLPILERIWSSRYIFRQHITYMAGEVPQRFNCRTEIDFDRRFGEEVIGDLPDMMDHVTLSLQELEEWKRTFGRAAT